MRVFGLVDRHMSAKVFLAVALVVGLSLVYQTVRDTRREVDVLKAESQRSAETIAQMTIGAIEHSMLQGEGIEVKALIAELVQRTPSARVQVFDPRGVEVFAPLPPPPRPEELAAAVRQGLTDGRRRVEAGVVYRPVPADARCRACHQESAALRGLLALEFDPAGCGAQREGAVVHLVEAGFIQIMTARRADLLDNYFDELRKAAPGVRGAAVFDVAGDLAFGSAVTGASRAAVREAAAGGEPRHSVWSGGTLELVPLPMQERCVWCHAENEGPVRGVLALCLAAPEGGGCPSEELEVVVDRSLRFIMLSRLGRRIDDFLDAAAQSGALRQLDLYDNLGRRYWSTRHGEPPAYVAEALQRRTEVAAFLGTGESERSLVVQPLPNLPACRRCHGGSDEPRGVVSVSLSTAMAAHLRQVTIQQRAWWSGILLLAILIILVGVLESLVLRPIRQIGQVADEVGQGNLAVSVARADAGGDEMARLGYRVNHMLFGLRTKLQLERFVSQGAAHAAEIADLRGVVRQGERRLAAILFSDIRGFTHFAETVPPEAVVEMLNRVLEAQARVVLAHAGDIDKFVGDALLAVFHAERAVPRAVESAVEMIEAVRSARARDETFSVGIGIAFGEVVYGAVGSEARMDFTVIGDIVNTASRLCSAADADQILVTEEVALACQEALAGIEFAPHPPLQVKGKREPVRVHAARRVG